MVDVRSRRDDNRSVWTSRVEVGVRDEELVVARTERIWEKDVEVEERICVTAVGGDFHTRVAIGWVRGRCSGS